MAYHIQSSFSAGELDPALHERTTFDKYQTGLATLRNAHIGKTGRPISRAGREHVIELKDPTPASGTFTNSGNLCTKTDHRFWTGMQLTVSTTNTLPSGLSANTIYYVIRVDVDTYYLATTLADALLSNVITLSSSGVGTHTVTPVQLTDKKAVLFCPPYSQYIVEWGHYYVRIHDSVAETYTDDFHDVSDEYLSTLQFVNSGVWVYIFSKNFTIKKMSLPVLTGVYPFLNRFLTVGESFAIPSAPSFTSKASTGLGYDVEYAFTQIVNGEESLFLGVTGALKLPIANGEKNTIVIATDSSATECRAYRRPINGNAYGFVGSFPSIVSVGTFVDIGEDADYTNSPPTIDFPDIATETPAAGCVYQQKLITSESTNLEAIHTSRTGYQNNFYRDYPLGADSALTFKAGTTGSAQVLRFVDSDGLLVFTTAGIYRSTGALSPDNLALERKGNWVIEETVPPLEIPGGLLFVDKSTNTVRNLIFSNEAGGYPGEEVSIFSNHLFVNKKVVSWAFQDGDIPLVWVVFDDGNAISLTYQREHQMNAWSRHDTVGDFESVTVLKDLTNKSVPYFIIKRGTERYIEKGAPRFVSDLKEYVGMDSSVTFNSELSEDGAVINVVAADITDWEGSLTLSSNLAVFANTADNGAIGTVFRFFDSQGSAVDLTVTAFVSTTQVTVTPSVEFPSDQNLNIKLYKTYSVLTGLDHLEGNLVSLMVDGYVEASPLNNIDNLPELLVTGGTITIPNSRRGAFVHVGLPFACDIETLDIDTVEQKPTLLESRLVNRVFLKVLNSRGLYVGSRFPENDYVDGMTDPEERIEDINLGNVGNAAQKPYTKRLDVAVPNDWNSNGKIFIRQVDPLPFEILSIIPDLTVLF